MKKALGLLVGIWLLLGISLNFMPVPPQVLGQNTLIHKLETINHIYIDGNWSATASTHSWCSGSGTFESPYIIDDVLIDGQNLTTCITIRNTNDYFIIRNCTIIRSYFSSYSDSSSSGDGIYLYFVENGRLENNHVHHNDRSGIYLHESDANTLTGNTVHDNGGAGIDLDLSDANTLTGNAIYNNGREGIFSWHAWNNTLTDNTVHYNGGDGISLWDSWNNTLTGNAVYNNSRDGIVLNEWKGTGGNNILTGNIAHHNGVGIVLSGSGDNTLTNNTVYNNSFAGIALSVCVTRASRNNILTGNTVHDNGGAGIDLDLSDANTFTGNTVNNNGGNGINLHRSDDNNITGNIINDNENIGIHLVHSSHNNMIMKNILRGNYKGIVIGSDCEGNILENNVIENRAVPNAPLLDPMLPNPDEDGIIELNWNDVVGATVYYVYRDTSPITFAVGTTPLVAIPTSHYQDAITINDIYYYVIVAGTATGNSPISNCENVIVAIPPAIPNFPILEPILPNPDYDGLIELNWSAVEGASTYYVYRNTSNITSIAGLTPIANPSATHYQDSIFSNEVYYYAIVAGNSTGNSSLSNCESVLVDKSSFISWEYQMEDEINSIAISSDGNYVVVGSNGGRVSLFHRSNSTPLWSYQIEPNSSSPVNSIAISADGSYFIIGSSNENIYLFQRTNSTPIWSYFVDCAPKVAISSDGFYIAASSGECYGTVSLFNRTSSSPMWSKFNGPVISIAISTDGSYIAYSYEGLYGMFMDTVALICLRNKSGHIIWDDYLGEGCYNPVVTSEDGSFILAGSEYLKLYNNTSGRPLWSLYNHYYYFDSVAISADGTYVIAGSYDGRVYLFNRICPTLQENFFTGVQYQLPHVAISADGHRAIAGGTDDNLYIFEVPALTPVGIISMGSDVNLLAISADGSCFATVSGLELMVFNGKNPLNAPILYPISSPNSDGQVQLNWSEVEGASTYHIYRATSPITSVYGITPIATVPTTAYQDTLSNGGCWYYAIVAENSSGRSAMSNCESVIVTIPPSAPTLASISPNPDGDGFIQLDWSNSVYATSYYIFRASIFITSTAGLPPLACVSGSEYQDVIALDGTHYYAIVASHVGGNSSISNCENVTIDLITPNIVNVTQDPTTIDQLESINISVHVQENVALALVQLESNHTGSLTNYTMDFLSGSLQDGIWNYTITTWPANTTIRYRIFAIDVAGRTVVTEFHHFGIFPTIEWNFTRDLDFEIDLGEVRDCTIAFNFENTGNTTFLNLNFTINLPLGWTAEITSVSIHRLAPQESASLLFRITAPDSEDEFLEVMSIEFEATILETGETYGDAITIVVTGKSTGDFIIWLIVIVGSVTGAATSSFIGIRMRRMKKKEQRIASLLTKVMNAPMVPPFVTPIPPNESQNIFDNQSELPEVHGEIVEAHGALLDSAVGECTESSEVLEDNHVINPPRIDFKHLIKVLNGIIESFPSLARQFPREGDVKYLMEEVSFPSQELLPFISSLLERVSVNELRTQICVRMNALRGLQDEGNVMHIIQKIDVLLYWAESTNDRRLLNDLFQLLLLIECS